MLWCSLETLANSRSVAFNGHHISFWVPGYGNFALFSLTPIARGGMAYGRIWQACKLPLMQRIRCKNPGQRFEAAWAAESSESSESSLSCLSRLTVTQPPTHLYGLVLLDAASISARTGLIA